MKATTKIKNKYNEQTTPQNQLLSRAIRPLTFDEFIGQDEIKYKLKVAIIGAKKKNRPIPHIILTGPAGTGKTTLAQIIANESQVKLVSRMGMHIKTDYDLLMVIKEVSDPNKPNILFIDEIHEIKAAAQEKLFTLIEDGFIDLKIKKSTVRLTPYPFTIIGATTDPGKLLKPLYSRFDMKITMEAYLLSDLEKIVAFRIKKEGYKAEKQAIISIAKRGKGTAREVGKYVNLVIDMHLALGNTEKDIITYDTVHTTFQLHGIDDEGLQQKVEIKYLKYLVSIYPEKIGLESMAQIIDEDKTFIEKQIEPFLIKKGYIHRGRGGRSITQEGIDYLLSHKYIKKDDLLGL